MFGDYQKCYKTRENTCLPSSDNMGHAKESNIESSVLFKVLCHEFALIVSLLIFGHQFLEVGGVITSLEVPKYIHHGDAATMQCKFDDSISDLRNFVWSSSLKTDGLGDAQELLSYNVIAKQWGGPAIDRMDAILNEVGLFSNLTISEVDYDIDDKRYWCIVRVASGASYDDKANTVVTVLNTAATNLLWSKEVVVDQTLDLANGEHKFECRVYGAKPAPTITWTLGDGGLDSVNTNSTNADRLIDSVSKVVVKIDNDFLEKVLTCKAKVPAYETAVSDNVTITRVVTTPTKNVGAIVGGVFGGIVVIGGVVGGVVYVCVYKEKN